uniref:TonB-dependent receptor plug domain-containing protein n=1 Tax=candidate division WOR-3 bacterium TaxID=2052148 RepID=A0A7C4TBG9_UNCW3
MAYNILYALLLFLSFVQSQDFDLYTDSYTLTADDMENLPVVDLDELLMLVPGINRDYNTLHFRGSTGMTEVAYYLDGIPIKNPDQINLSMIDKISIQKSGFSAEYGTGFSGIIFIKTKRQQRSALVSYLTDEIFTTDRLNYGFNQYNIHNQWCINKNLGYIFSGTYLFTDDHYSGLYKVSAPKNCYNGLVNIYYQLGDKGNISVMGYAFRNQFMIWHPNIVGGNGYKYFDQRPMNREKSQSIMAKWEIPLGNKTISSVRFIKINFDSVFGNRDYEWEEKNGYKWYNDYHLKGEHLINYLKKDALSVREILVDSLSRYHNEIDKNSAGTLRHNPYAITGLFYINGDYPAWCYYNTVSNQFLLQLRHSITNQNEFKCGIEYKWQKTKYYDNTLPWYSGTFWNYENLKPHNISGYLEDQWLTNRIGICAGLRYSYIDYGFYQPLIVPQSGSDTITTLKKNFFSPRLGIVLPVSKPLNIFFNGGEYYYEPAEYSGSPEPERTRLFEIGFKWNPEPDFAFNLSLYQKYLYDFLIQKIENYYGYYWPPYYFYSYTQIERADVNGIELCLEKSIFAVISSGISYHLQFANQMPVYRYDYYYNYYPDIDPITTEPVNLENRYYPLNYDCRNNLKAYLTLRIEEFYLTLLNNSTISFFLSSYAGLPYTPEDLKGNPLADMNSARMPGYSNLDLKYQKYSKISSAKLIFTCLINNLFNTKQIIYVYPTTGRPDDHGDPEPPISQFGGLSITSAYYSPQADLDHNGVITPIEMRDEYVRALKDYYANPLHYNNSFRIRFGIGLEI